MYASVPPYTYSDSPPRSTVSKQTIVVTSYMQWGRERGEEGKGGEGMVEGRAEVRGRGGEEERREREGRVEGKAEVRGRGGGEERREREGRGGCMGEGQR